ncbi:hypothetical protein [Streptomyces sp. RPA4-5]|nr:hypothetical protein [Streptomyces sp. RPA4-5]
MLASTQARRVSAIGSRSSAVPPRAVISSLNRRQTMSVPIR